MGSPHATDREILKWAKAHDHVGFTHDLDFGILLALTQSEGPASCRSAHSIPSLRIALFRPCEVEAIAPFRAPTEVPAIWLYVDPRTDCQVW